jgi:hypothetical protein
MWRQQLGIILTVTTNGVQRSMRTVYRYGTAVVIAQEESHEAVELKGEEL